MEKPSIGMSQNLSPSPLSELAVKHEPTCQNVMKVNLIGIEVEEKDWERFKDRISEAERTRFIQNVFGDMLKELLYDNPELFNSYAKPS